MARLSLADTPVVGGGAPLCAAAVRDRSDSDFAASRNGVRTDTSPSGTEVRASWLPRSSIGWTRAAKSRNSNTNLHCELFKNTTDPVEDERDGEDRDS
jgi:hypothetical protein